MITFHFQNIDPINIPEKTKDLLSYIIKNEQKKQGEINYIFCNDNYLLTINNNFLSHDYFTDIITFDYVKGNAISGDIFVSLPRVKENSEKLQENFNDELIRVLSHGILHLCGYHDKTPEEITTMRAKENFYLEAFKNNLE